MPTGISESERGVRSLAKMTFGRLGTQGVMIASAIVIPRTLGSEGYGLFAALMAVVAIVQAGAALGLPTVEVRFLAPLWRRPERGDGLALASTIWIVRLALAVVGSLTVMAWLGASQELALSHATCGLLGAFALGRIALEATKSLMLPLGHVGKLAAFDFARAALTLPVVVGLYPTFGLVGVFAGLTLLQLGLFTAGIGTLRRIAPVGPSHFRWSSLRPHAGFSAATFVGGLSGMFQAQFAIYAVASWVTHEEAGYLGISVQAYTLLQVLYLSGRRSLMPHLAELQTQGQDARLAHWGGVMMRYCAAALGALVVLWSLLGRYAVHWVLTDAFAPVYECTTLILFATTFFCCAGSCNGLLFVRELPRIGSINTLLYAIATVLGIVWVLGGDGAGTSLRIAGVYAVAAGLFFACAYTSLGIFGQLWLPLRRTALLLLPTLLAWPAYVWDAGLTPRIAAACVFIAGFAGYAVVLRLLPAEEVAEITRIVSRR